MRGAHMDMPKKPSEMAEEMKEHYPPPKKKKRHMGQTAADGAAALAKRLGY